jgi:hypothetical protein
MVQCYHCNKVLNDQWVKKQGASLMGKKGIGKSKARPETASMAGRKRWESAKREELYFAFTGGWQSLLDWFRDNKEPLNVNNALKPAFKEWLAQTYPQLAEDKAALKKLPLYVDLDLNTETAIEES